MSDHVARLTFSGFGIPYVCSGRFSGRVEPIHLPSRFPQIGASVEMNTEISVFAVFFAAVFTNNVLLTNYLGMCSFLGASREVRTALGLGAAVTLVTTFTSVLNWCAYRYLLVPLDLTYLRFIVFIMIIAAFVQIAEIVMERFSRRLHAALGIFLPLITVNCAILGVCLFMVIREYTFVQSFAYGLGGGLGWLLAIAAMAGIRWKMSGRSRVPEPLAGAGISLVVAGIMAIAFIGFSGVIRI
jgi:Na+-transporting NADH:ubiquinone oxidoreductase subunit E